MAETAEKPAAAEAKNGETNGTANGEELGAKIIKQIEYYFGDYNLPRDKFLKEEVKKDDGWIPMDTMIKFQRLANLSTDIDVLLKSVKSSTSKLMEVDEENKKIRRDPTKPLPIFNDEVKEETVKRTVYCKGFPKDGSQTLDNLLEYFTPYGPYETVLMRYYFDKDKKKQGFKGSVFIVFHTEEKAKEFMDLEEVKFGGTVLIRKFHADYSAEKKEEFEKRLKSKEAKKTEEKEAEILNEVPEGCFLRIEGMEKGTSREDIKEEIKKHTDDLAFVDSNRDDVAGFLRFGTPEATKEIMEKLKGKLTIKDKEVTLRVVEGEEEVEQMAKAKMAKSRAMASKKRGFSGGRGGGRFKRRRKN